MEEKLRDENDTKDYDIFKEDLSSLEVVDENASKQVPTNSAPSTYKSLSSKRNVIIGILTLLVIILLVIGAGFALRKKTNTKPQTTYVINTQTLDNGTLNKLTAQTGSGKQQLTISPDTLFQNNVSVSKTLAVQGDTTLQSAVSITKGLLVGGNIGVGGSLSVTGQISAGSLNVGTVTISSLKLSSNLEFEGHLISTGASPSIKTNIAARDGTATVDGSDTAGNITITTGNSLGIAGQMATITFRSAFGGLPNVQLTPTNGAAAKLSYFVTKNAGFFTIETASVADPITSYSFDYFVTQ